MKYVFIVLALIVWNSPSLAGREAGNGGDVVVCRDHEVITSIEVLDYHEARTKRGIATDLGAKTLSVEEKIELALASFAKKAPFLAQHLRSRAHAFMDEALFLNDIEMEDIEDSEHETSTKGCKVEQIIIRKTPRFPEDRLFTINNDLWKKLDNDSKAGLILHEVIYEMALIEGETNSIGARYLNSLIAARKIEHMCSQQIIQIFKAAKLSRIDLQGTPLLVIPFEGEMTRIAFYEDGTIKEASLYSKFPYNRPYENVPVNVGSLTIPAVALNATYFPNGSVKTLWFAKGASFNFQLNVGGKEMSFDNSCGDYLDDSKTFVPAIASLEFHDNGSVSKACNKGRAIRFDPLGKLL